jgi:AcrR family transcriptional regulator
VSGEKLSRRERRRLEIRDRILESAVALFEARGYEADRVLRDLFTDVEEFRKGPGSFGEHLVALFEGTAERADQMGPKSRELLGAMLSMAYPETAATDDLRMRSAFRAFMEDGFEAGAIRDDVDRETLIEVVIGTWYSMFRSWVHFDDYPLQERAASAGRLLAETLTRTTAPTTTPATAASEQ